MPGTTCQQLIDQTRRFLRDWPDQDVLTASVASTTTTLSIADGTIYYKNWHLELDQEILTTSANGSGTTVGVRRGALGSTAASHASTAIVLIRPDFFAYEIIDALNEAMMNAYPRVYKPVLDTSLTTLSNTYEYTVPNMPGTYQGSTIPIPYLSKIELKPTGGLDYQEIRGWSIRRGATPKIQFVINPDIGTLRVHGYGPFPEFTAVTDSVDAQFPVHLVKALRVGASSTLLDSGEAGRVRVDTLAQDDREQANRVGSSMSVAARLEQRFQRMIMAGAPPAMPPHVKPTY